MGVYIDRGAFGVSRSDSISIFYRRGLRGYLPHYYVLRAKENVMTLFDLIAAASFLIGVVIVCSAIVSLLFQPDDDAHGAMYE